MLISKHNHRILAVYLLALMAAAVGVMVEPRLAILAATAIVVALGSSLMTYFYSWLLKLSNQHKARVRTGKKFWLALVAVALIAAAIVFVTSADATLAGFLAGLAIYGFQSFNAEAEPA